MALLDTGGRTPGYVVGLNLLPNYNKYLRDFVSQLTLFVRLFFESILVKVSLYKYSLKPQQLLLI